MCLAETLGMIGIFAFPTLLPRFFEIWNLSHTQAGWISGIYFAGYTLAVPLLVSLTDRVDARRIYLLFTGVGALAAIGFALLAQGFWTALLFRALAGLGLAGTFMPGLKALVDRLDGKAQARAVSFYTATFSLGTSLSFFATGQLDALLGWRWAFACGAAGSVVAFLIAAAVLQPKAATTGDLPPSPLLDFRPILRNFEALIFILAYAAHTWELFIFRSWIVAFLTFNLSLQADGGSSLSPSSVAALTALVAMWASIGGAELAMRFGRRRTLLWVMGGSALIAGGIGFAAVLPYLVLVGLLMIYALFVQGDSATLHTGVVQAAEPDRRGATMAVQSLLGFATAFAGPLAIGMVLDMTGSGQTVLSWVAAFIATGVGVAAGPVCLLFLPRDSDRAKLIHPASRPSRFDDQPES
jgi:MFS family permease